MTSFPRDCLFGREREKQEREYGRIITREGRHAICSVILYYCTLSWCYRLMIGTLPLRGIRCISAQFAHDVVDRFPVRHLLFTARRIDGTEKYWTNCCRSRNQRSLSSISHESSKSTCNPLLDHFISYIFHHGTIDMGFQRSRLRTHVVQPCRYSISPVHHHIMSEDPAPLKIRRSLWNLIHPIITSYLL